MSDNTVLSLTWAMIPKPSCRERHARRDDVIIHGTLRLNAVDGLLQSLGADGGDQGVNRGVDNVIRLDQSGSPFFERDIEVRPCLFNGQGVRHRPGSLP
jgi:hypothetical protein